ncbi:hypothetical protein A2U01_0070022, partial [Trifolium medium]|nr:hypothetical protein [Trifolium medium]
CNKLYPKQDDHVKTPKLDKPTTRYAEVGRKYVGEIVVSKTPPVVDDQMPPLIEASNVDVEQNSEDVALANNDEEKLAATMRNVEVTIVTHIEEDVPHNNDTET